jgi:huntingtin-interacting protein 1-related protein
LLRKLDAKAGEVESLREEKDQEIAIMQEGLDSTIQQLGEVQQVG